MHVKTRSRCTAAYAGNGEGGVSKHRSKGRWLAFALTPQQAAILKSQPHLEGDIEGSCFGGPNEFDLSMHP
jgi:hypothetical protein